MQQNINLKLRSEILEYSLNIENSINFLLLTYLGILEKSSTKLFGSKVGLSFKNKIDLLFDIDVLSKEEHSNLELFMNFRNKFIHDINSNSFLSIIEKFDNGIKNCFKKHFEINANINEEEACRKAYFNLFMNNLEVIKKKLEKKQSRIKYNRELLTTHLEKHIRMLDLSFNFVDDLLKILELLDLTNPEVRKVSEIIMKKCLAYTEQIGTDKQMILLDSKLKVFHQNDSVKKFLKG